MTTKLIKRSSRTKGKSARPRGLAGLVAKVGGKTPENKFPEFRPGDQIKVHTKIKEGAKERIQIFEGIVLKDRNTQEGGAFTVRKSSHGVGVEKTFLRRSPKVAKVEVVYPGKVRRAKLYYLRELEGKAAKVDRDLAAIEARSKAAREAKLAESKKDKAAQ